MKKMELIILGVIALGVVGVGYMWAAAPKQSNETIDEPGKAPGKTAVLQVEEFLIDALKAASGETTKTKIALAHHDYVAGFKT